MYRDFLQTSSLLALPLVALVTFMVVFAAVLVRALTYRHVEVDTAARLPLAPEERDHDHAR
ncbi:CcoQ/FixQ family Cbb3-type cytochrome c oxidase assembly chaperone [Pendulispora brunnea]|uniref:CcoQ/FixQ family Cbb3-type cytochrome c oxidase assembly chaperone n=1 Tax=Pendulispora brunnea TaxID=2905690 RepID=A0ABZ2K5Q6_9BACT